MARLPPLEKLHIYLTNNCNEHCNHCWVESSRNNIICLNPIEIKKQIDNAIPLGLKVLKITGGEPLLFKKALFDILNYSKFKCLQTRLETNGLLINEDDSSKLHSLGTKVYISLDGSTPKIHDNFRNLVGSFNLTLASIKRLIKYDVPVEIISCIHKDNLDDIEDIISLCCSIGVKSIKFNFPSPYGRGKELKCNGGLLTAKEIIRISRYIEKNYHDKINLDIDIPRVFRVYPNPKKRCDVLNILSILPDGRYSLCGIGVTHKDLTFGNIKYNNINKVWKNNSILREMRKTIPKQGKGVCGFCADYGKCYSHCLAYSLEIYESLNGPHPICQEAFDLGFFPKGKIVVQ